MMKVFSVEYKGPKRKACAKIIYEFRNMEAKTENVLATLGKFTSCSS